MSLSLPLPWPLLVSRRFRVPNQSFAPTLHDDGPHLHRPKARLAWCRLQANEWTAWLIVRDGRQEEVPARSIGWHSCPHIVALYLCPPSVTAPGHSFMSFMGRRLAIQSFRMSEPAPFLTAPVPRSAGRSARQVAPKSSRKKNRSKYGAGHGCERRFVECPWSSGTDPARRPTC